MLRQAGGRRERSAASRDAACAAKRWVGGWWGGSLLGCTDVGWWVALSVCLALHPWLVAGLLNGV